MERNRAILVALALTATMGAALLFFSRATGASDTALPVAAAQDPAPTAAVVEVASPQAEYEAALAAREAALLDQVAQRQAAVEALDATYGEQLAALEQQLADTNNGLLASSERIDGLQVEAELAQGQIAAADTGFKGEMAALQGGLAARDQALRTQIEDVYAQLQQAYDQLAARASVAQADTGRDDSPPPPPAIGPGDDHGGDQDEHEGEHEDEHEDDHGDDHGDEHDD